MRSITGWFQKVRVILRAVLVSLSGKATKPQRQGPGENSKGPDWYDGSVGPETDENLDT
jgi:hypothetical protein